MSSDIKVIDTDTTTNKSNDIEEVRVSYTPKPFNPDKYVMINDEVLSNLQGDGDTWIRYIRSDGKLVSGGFLVKNHFPDYLILMNPTTSTRWCAACNKGNKFMVLKHALPRIKKSILKEELWREFKGK